MGVVWREKFACLLMRHSFHLALVGLGPPIPVPIHVLSDINDRGLKMDLFIVVVLFFEGSAHLTRHTSPIQFVTNDYNA
eukprot:gene1301-751_t